MTLARLTDQFSRCSFTTTASYSSPRTTSSSQRHCQSAFVKNSVLLQSRQDRRKHALSSRRESAVRVIAMAGKVTGTVSLALQAGKANPAPPVGPALGAQGVNIMDFCKKYNAATQDKVGQIIPVEITIFEDRTFEFILKTPPASFLIKQAAGVQKGSKSPNKEKVGQITLDQLREIAQTKLPDLNTNDVDAAMRTIEGTAKSMGITIAED